MKEVYTMGVSVSGLWEEFQKKIHVDPLISWGYWLKFTLVVKYEISLVSAFIKYFIP